jgi:hypothetical protein
MGAERTEHRDWALTNQRQTSLDTDAIDYATHLVHQVCCFAGPFDLIEEFRDQELCAAVEAA